MATALVVVHGLSEGRVLGTAHGQAALTSAPAGGDGTGRLLLLDTLVPAAGLAATKQGRQPFLQPQHFATFNLSLFQNYDNHKSGFTVENTPVREQLSPVEYRVEN